MSAKYPILIICVLIFLALLFYGINRDLQDFVDMLILSAGFGILGGVLSSFMFGWIEGEKQKALIIKRLQPHMGHYNVSVWGRSEKDIYQVELTIFDSLNAIILVEQIGKNDDHEMIGHITMDKTFSYGQGHYRHPKKDRSPIGKIRIFIVDSKIINVDKLYLDDSGHTMNFEKWQWKR